LANPELGAKQICPSCQSKFYDLGRRPAVCPKCGAEFDPEEALKSRRVRARTAVPDYEAEEEKPEAKPAEVESDGFEEEPDETPEVDVVTAEVIEVDEDADEVEGAPTAAPDDLGVDFVEEELEEADDEVPFLEDEDDDEDFEGEIEGLPEDERD
jgi:uncharacterized protein (TIGR02300 family)